jgi:hypothetical protein
MILSDSIYMQKHILKIRSKLKLNFSKIETTRYNFNKLNQNIIYTYIVV